MHDIRLLNLTVSRQEYPAKADIYRVFCALVPVPVIPFSRVAAQSGFLTTVSCVGDNRVGSVDSVGRASQSTVDVTLNTSTLGVRATTT